jgi:phosphoglycerate kinase
MKKITEMDLTGKKTFIRVDFNVPIKDSIVQDDTRIKEALKTIQYAMKEGAKVILASHLGRPKGEKRPELSLKPVADYINEHFFKVDFIDDCIGKNVVEKVEQMKNGEAILLENLRYYKGEEKNYPEFVEELLKFTEIYVNDAFGTCHRKHASVYGLPEKVTEKSPGFLVEKEIEYFENLLNNPRKPFAAILGGAKVSDKIGVIKSLINIGDKIFIGGAMAYTFLFYKGFSVGKSLVEKDSLNTVKSIYLEAEKKGVNIYTPVDHICSKEFNGSPVEINSTDIPNDFMGLDIGSVTIKTYLKELDSCRTVLWNGPMGVFENPNYSKGTFAIANYLAESNAVVVVGGGDSVSAVKKAGIADKINHISTGGGASLEYIEFGSLPGVEVLQ